MAGRTGTGGPGSGVTNPAVRPLCGLSVVLAVGLMVVALRLEGRRWWCGSGDPWPWSAGVHDGHTSQHLFDPYSFTHALHGLLLYALLRLAAGRLRTDVRLVLAVALEGLWEVVENSTFVIDRYRQGTFALGYDGDAVLNSLGDLASCGLGFWLAGRLPARWSVALFLLVDLALLAVYRDNLLLNVVMLAHPFEALKSWQAGR